MLTVSSIVNSKDVGTFGYVRPPLAHFSYTQPLIRNTSTGSLPFQLITYKLRYYFKPVKHHDERCETVGPLLFDLLPTVEFPGDTDSGLCHQRCRPRRCAPLELSFAKVE